jgi:hypothetical protein
MITYEQARKHGEYSRIPEHILQSLYAYVEHRQAPGHFLTCVLTNDLFGAIGRADKEAVAALRELVVFIHMEVRSDCHGSPAKVGQWLFPKPEA